MKIFQRYINITSHSMDYMDKIVDEETLKKANEWWENLPAITKIAIFEDLWDIMEEP